MSLLSFRGTPLLLWTVAKKVIAQSAAADAYFLIIEFNYGKNDD
jgi:hypothetical protein